MFIKGLVLQKKVHHLDYMRGSTLILDKGENGNSIPDSSVSSISDSWESMSVDPEESALKQDLHPCLSETLYDDYRKLLEDKTEIKTFLNTECGNLDNSIIDKVFNDITGNLKAKSPEYCDGLEKVLTRGFRNVVDNGIPLHKYKPMAISPRIYPSNYETVLYLVKASLREEILLCLTSKLRDKGY